MRDLPSGTVTFLFTDVEGSTKLLHELGAEAYAEALAEHRRVIREACRAHGGVEVDTQGDAFFFAFPTAPGALAAASAMTEALASGEVRVRVGLHTGTPLVAEEGYVGDDVHFAARVAASSHGGQVVLSAATASVVTPSGSEPQALSLVDLGEHRLKDIDGPVAIFQLGDASFPPLKTISNTNLPRPASSFVGRDAELGEVLGRFERGARLVTLTGPGGSGKTRLAIEAASTLVPEYKSGVFWVGLASLRDSALVSETIGQTLGAKDGLAEHIGGRELLLLLDNLEQVIDAAPELSALLSSCPNLTLLVTSRELLRVQGEVEYPVPPLAVPEAVSLFCERAQLEPSEEIAELCARLDSLPLAVELAAARTKALSPSQILERLSQHLDLLKGGRDADPRQRTLRATIEWSYHLLSPDEQYLFRRLSVFTGGCTLEAAEQVADADLDTLQSLVEKSLVRFSNARYWMLETIREYASESARLAGESAALAERHFAFFVRCAEDLRGGLWDAEHGQTMQRYEVEYPNLRAALSWSSTAAEGRFLSRLAFTMSDFWRASDHLREGREWLERAYELDGADPTELRVRALCNSSSIAMLLGDTHAALLRATQALELARELGDVAGSALALTRVAGARAEGGDDDGARRLFEEAVELARAAGDERTTAIALTGVAGMQLDDGRWEAAETAYDEARALFERSGNRRGLALSLSGLAIAALGLGRRAEAAGLFEESAALYKVLETKVWTARLLERVAELELDAGDTRRALRMLGAAQRLREDTGARPKPHDEPDELVTKALAAGLDPSEAAALLDDGRALSMSEALDDVLSGLD